MIDFILFFTAIVGRANSISRISGLAADNITLNATYDNVTHLINSMLKTYDIRLRPNFAEKALVLDLDIAVASFDSVSEVNMDWTLTMYLYQYWRDERLAWLPNYRNESITLSGDFSQKIWVPDTFLANDKSSYLHDVTETNKMLKLYSDGYIAYGMRFTSTLACKMDLRSFPLDRQNFSVEIESYGYTTDDLFMRWRNGRQSIRGVMETEIPQFRILNYEALDRIEVTDTGKYQRLSLVLVLRRSVGYYMFQTYFPSTLIVALSWISFWINHEATAARVALGVTTVLTMTTISTGVRASLPRISYIKAIDIYLVMCFVFVFAALLEYAAVNYTYWGTTRMNRKSRRRPSEAVLEHMEFDSHRKLTNTQAKEFPTWEMYVKNEEEEPDITLDYDPRRKSQGGESIIDKDDHDEEENLPEKDQTRFDPGPEDEIETEFGGCPQHSRPLRMGGQRNLTGRVSPIPGLLQQLRRQPIPESCIASTSSIEERNEEAPLASWTSLMMGDEYIARPPSPAVVLHSGSGAVRRRPPPSTTITPVTNAPPFEQHLLNYSESGGEGENNSGKKRRRTHPPQGHRGRRCVSFSIWRSKGIGSSSAPTSCHSSARLSRHMPLTRREFVTSLRRKARAVRAVLPRIRDVNVIDKWSRAMFPLSFVLFNFIYWCYYVFSDWND